MSTNPFEKIANGGDATQAAVGSGNQGSVASGQPDAAADAANAKKQNEIQETLRETDSGPAPVRTAVDTGTIPASVGIVGAVDRAPDADTVIVHPAEGVAAHTEAEKVAEEEDNRVTYTSHPILRFAIGNDYEFENGQLKLDPKDVDKFEKVLSEQPPQIQNQVRRLDPNAAEEFVRTQIGSKSVQGMDSTANVLPTP